MPVKKSELYSSLWSSCDELRGGMEALLTVEVSALEGKTSHQLNTVGFRP
jgi:hypothetical protein